MKNSAIMRNLRIAGILCVLALLAHGTTWGQTGTGMMPGVWKAIEAMHANTLEVPVYWEQIEPNRQERTSG